MGNLEKILLGILFISFIIAPFADYIIFKEVSLPQYISLCFFESFCFIVGYVTGRFFK